MKKIEATFRPFKLDEIKIALLGLGITGFTVTEARVLKGGSFFQMFCLYLVVPDDKADNTVETIQKSGPTGEVGDFTMSVSEEVQGIRIASGSASE